MAKLNGYRIVNLTYNIKDDNSRTFTNRIMDQHFELDGLQTLMLLQNGGGKSVQIQMLISPFVSPKHRDFGNRPFTDYFTDDKTPTYIATEWLLDNGEKVLIGLMVRKCKPHEVTDTNKGLDIYAYIYEYNNKYDEYSIGNIPFATRTDEGYIVASTQESLELFANIKKRNRFAMEYYNLGSSNARTTYYNKLKTYEIYRNEWETIMKVINSSEGGLTELFKNCDDEYKLIEEWFLKTIHSKLNKDVNQLEEMRNVFSKYFRDKQNNQHAIDVVDGIAEYTQYANNILNENNAHKKALEEIKNNKSRIEDIYTYNHRTNNKLKEDKEKIIQSQQELQKKLAMTKYKEASYKYYLVKDKADKAKTEQEKEENKLKELESELAKLEREDKLQEVIKINCEKVHKEQELAELIAKREKENQTNEEIRTQLENVAYSLRSYLDDELDGKYEILDKLKCDKDNFNNERSDINKDLGAINESNKNLNKEKLAATNIIEELKPKIDILLPKYNAPLIVDDSFFEKIELNKNEQISAKQKIIDTTTNELELLKVEEDNLNLELSTLQKQECELDTDLKIKSNKLDEMNKQCERMEEILKFLELNTENIYDTTSTLKEIRNRISSVQQKINSYSDSKKKMNIEIEQLEKGVVVEIPKEVKDLLKDLGISYQLGLYYISKLNISLEQKEELIEKNPFLPFSILINSEDIEILKNSKFNLSSSYTVYIANIDKISTPVEYALSNNIREVGSLNMFYNFNKSLLDENEKTNMISRIKNYILKLENLIDNNEAHKENLESKKFFVQDFKITKLSVTIAQEQVTNLQSELDKLSENKKVKFNRINEIKKKFIPEKKELLNNLNEESKKLSSELEEIKLFRNDYKNLNKESIHLDNVITQLQENDEKLTKHTKRLSEISQLEGVLDKEIRTSESSIKETQAILDDIKVLKFRFENPTTIEADKNTLLAQFKVLKEDSNKDIKEIQLQIEKVDNEIKYKVEEINQLTSLYELESSEYLNKEFTIERKLFIAKSINIIKDKIARHREVVSELLQNFSKMQSKEERALEDAKKESNKVKKTYEKYNSFIDINEHAIDKSLIDETNFGKLINDIQASIKKSEEDIIDTDSKLALINSSTQNLNFLSQIREGIENIDSRKINLDINLENLLSVTKHEIESYRALEQSINNIKSNVDKLLTSLSTDFKYRDIDPYAKHIKGLLNFAFSPETIEEIINTTLESLEKRRLQYEDDLKIVDKEYRSTVNTILKYVENIHNHMDSIDTNSSIRLDNRREKMLQIKQPNWDLANATLKIELFINELIDGCEKRSLLGETTSQTADEFIATQITTTKLYNVVIGINNVEISIKKLEFAGEEIDVSPISWKRAQKNSGGEGFATYFIILISLLSYMRKEGSTIGDRIKESSKVLIMDNPFGKISSEHLLKPVMEIAKKYNTQLLCFTAQKGDNIYNEFSNIYHLNLEVIRSLKTRILTSSRTISKTVDKKDVYLQSSQLKLLELD